MSEICFQGCSFRASGDVSDSNGSFTLADPDSDSDLDSDSKPYGYIVLFRTFHIGSDLDPDPFPLVFV